MVVSPHRRARFVAVAFTLAVAIPWLPSTFATPSPTSATAKSVTVDVPSGDRVDLVLAVARRQLGKPYRWGGVGPASFDCSGFTAFVWKAAGVHLPHSSSAQRTATTAVPLHKMRRGDLVFAPGHVGMYVGGGKMIHSPRTGRTVEIAPLHSNAYAAGRPVV